MTDYLMNIIKYVSNSCYGSEVRQKKQQINEFREYVEDVFEKSKQNPSKLEKLVRMPISEFEEKMGITKGINDLGLYPAGGC